MSQSPPSTRICTECHIGCPLTDFINDGTVCASCRVQDPEKTPSEEEADDQQQNQPTHLYVDPDGNWQPCVIVYISIADDSNFVEIRDINTQKTIATIDKKITPYNQQLVGKPFASSNDVNDGAKTSDNQTRKNRNDNNNDDNTNSQVDKQSTTQQQENTIGDTETDNTEGRSVRFDNTVTVINDSATPPVSIAITDTAAIAAKNIEILVALKKAANDSNSQLSVQELQMLYQT